MLSVLFVAIGTRRAFCTSIECYGWDKASMMIVVKNAWMDPFSNLHPLFGSVKDFWVSFCFLLFWWYFSIMSVGFLNYFSIMSTMCGKGEFQNSAKRNLSLQ